MENRVIPMYRDRRLRLLALSPVPQGASSYLYLECAEARGTDRYSMCEEAWHILAKEFDYQPKTDDTHNYSTMGINLTTIYNTYSGFGKRTNEVHNWVLTPKAFVEFYLANSEFILGANAPKQSSNSTIGSSLSTLTNFYEESEFNMKIAQTQYNYKFSIINLGDEDTAQACVQSGEIMGRNARHIMNQLLQRYNELDFDRHRVDLKRLAGDGVCD